MRYVGITFGIMAAGLAGFVPWYFGQRKPGYSHVYHTISEIGEAGAPDQAKVAYLGFLPIGVASWLFLVASSFCFPPDQQSTCGTFLLGFVGLGYVASAVFPCDRGAPLSGSWKNNLHVLFGGLGYVGAGVGFILLAESFNAVASWGRLAEYTKWSGYIVLLATLGVSIPGLPVRGLVQRIAESVIFAWVLVVSVSLSL